MFRNSYKQANDSIHPREDLLQEMQRRQTQQKPLWKAPARWGTLAACVLVMISLGVWLLGQSYGNKKMQMILRRRPPNTKVKKNP